MVNFRKCEICGRALEGAEAGQQVVENRRLDAAAGAVLQREVPGDLPPGSVCDECLLQYRRETGRSGPPEPAGA